MTNIEKMADDLVAVDTDYIAELVSLRIAKKLTVETVAERMGVSVEFITDFERYRHDPTLSQLRRYALAVETLVTHNVAALNDISFAKPGEVWNIRYVPGLLRRTGFLNRGGQHLVYEANGGKLFLKRLDPDGARGHLNIDSPEIASATRVDFSALETSS